jgi:hypothetical protein
LSACTTTADGGRLLGTSIDELLSGDKNSEWLVYFPFVQQWASSFNGTYLSARERVSEGGLVARYWTASQFTGEVPEDPSNACKVEYSKASDYMAHCIFMYAYNDGATWGESWVYSAISEVPARNDVSWNENLNKGNAYPVRCVKD